MFFDLTEDLEFINRCKMWYCRQVWPIERKNVIKEFFGSGHIDVFDGLSLLLRLLYKKSLQLTVLSFADLQFAVFLIPENDRILQ